MSPPVGPFERMYPKLGTLFFCVGAQKASTSWLASELSRHPDCHIPRVKEMHYWTLARPEGYPPAVLARHRKLVRDAAWGVLRAALRPSAREAALVRLRLTRTRLAARADGSIEDYARRMMAGYRGEAVAGELTPEYAELDPAVFARMAALHRDVRFIFAMRDPVERLWSGVRHRERHWPGGDGDKLAALRQAFDDAVQDPGSRHHARSRYDRTIAALESVVPADRILYLFYETVREPQELARIADFLGLGAPDWHVGRRVNAASKDDARPRPEDIAAARAAFAPVYAFAAERFGAAVPAAWHGPATE